MDSDLRASHGPNAPIAIVGAGWAGLAAAVTLADQGVPTRLFEASRSLGGRARRVSVDGTELDNGQHVLIGAYRETLAMMRRVGADPARLLLRQPMELRFADGFHLRAAPLPYPFNLALALCAASGLPVSDRLAAARFMAGLHTGKFRDDPDRSVSRLLAEQAQGARVRAHLWEPLCVSALNTPTERASARVFVSVLRDALSGSRENSDLLLPRADLGAIFPEPAGLFLQQRGVSIELGSAVRRIVPEAGRLRIDDRAERFGAVILACAPQHVPALLPDLPSLAETRRLVEAFEYEPIVTCYLRYPDSVRLPSPMLGFTGGIVQWAFDRGRLSSQPGLIAAVISASGAHAELSRECLSERIHEELARALADLPRPRWSRVITERRATFSCTPGLKRPGNATAVPDLMLAGDYTESEYPATLEAAVRSGIRAARLVLDGRQA